MSSKTIKYWCDSGANAFSCREGEGTTFQIAMINCGRQVPIVGSVCRLAIVVKSSQVSPDAKGVSMSPAYRGWLMVVSASNVWFLL